MTVKETYDYLESVKKISRIIENKRTEYDEIFSIATQMSVKTDGMPHATGTSDKVGNASVKLRHISEQINENILLLVNFKNEVVTNLEKLPASQYNILYDLYIKQIPIGNYADNENKRLNTVKKHRGEAVRKLADLITVETPLYAIIKGKY